MLSLKTKFFYTNVRYNRENEKQILNSLYAQLGPEARLWVNMAKFFGNNSFVAREGLWPTPWQMELPPIFKMPQFEPDFALSFAEVTDLRATEIKQLINRTGARVALYYSGGIDSTVCLVSLLRNLTPEELKQVDIGLSSESIIENPHFFEKFIAGRFNIIDSAVVRYNDIEAAGNYAITCDQGDSIFGTEIGTHLYHSYNQLLKNISYTSRINLQHKRPKVSDADTHFSEYADLIIAFFHLDSDPDFGRQFYERLVQNIDSVSISVKSLHDFFWWEIFNIKYVECGLRSALYYYAGPDYSKAINETIINWFNHPDYQKWSMVSNNNGQKISWASPVGYKWAARKYIYEFDQNNWYFKYKTKLPSLRSIILRNEGWLNEKSVFAMDTGYKLLYGVDPEIILLFREGLQKFG